MNNKQRTVSAYTLGCKVNQYDTTAMLELLEAAGYQAVEWGAAADVYLVNTCTVTNVADKKSRNIIGRAARMNPDGVVCVCGCLPQSAADELLALDGVDAVVGTSDRGRIVEIVEACLAGRKVNAVDDISQPAAFESLHVRTSGELTRGYVKIQEGCNNFCSYCIIPYVRGSARSRDAADILQEVEQLAQSGVKEIVLTGIHISSYGDGTGSALLELIRNIGRADGIRRIRLGSLEPFVLTDAFVDGLARIPAVCPHFHVSLQSGSDATLRRMNRRYTAAQYAQFIATIRRHYDTPAITTDVITGFPGEDETEFAETTDFVRQAGFARLHVFPYSERAGTAAAGMDGRVPAAVRKARAQEMISLGKEMEHAYTERFIGKKQAVLLEQAHGGYMEGYTTRYVRVRARGGAPGEIRDVLPGRRQGDILYGAIID